MKNWAELREEEYDKPYAIKLREFLAEERKKYVIFPDQNNYFTAYDLCPRENVKVCVISQDPYHTPGIAHGLAFSSNDWKYIPPSLRNIHREVYDNFPKDSRRITTGSLIGWARQGVLLINICNTVRAYESDSHLGAGWEDFTVNMVQSLSELNRTLVFILWGANAKRFKTYVPSNSIILEAVHPSPYSADKGGWFGHKHFSQCNDILIQQKLKPIDWFQNT